MPASTMVGIIGCGEMGETHARCIAEIGTSTIGALCDRDEKRARRLLQYAPDAYVCSDPERLFQDDRLDGVYVCTHNDSHARLGIAAANAGKHVLMEKPVAMTLQECHDLLDAVDRSGIHFMTAFKLRYYPSVRRVREFIPSPLLCIAQMIDERWADSFWGNDPHQGGGNVLSQGCHAADLMCHLLRSEPARVYAHGGNYHHPEITTTDLLAATITFASGATGSLVVGDVGRTPYISKLSFQIMDGSRTAHLYDRLKKTHLWDGTQDLYHSESDETGVQEENKEFLEVLSGSSRPSASVRDGIRATVLLLRALESMQTGQSQSAEL
jgi:predicted dehydrogenase